MGTIYFGKDITFLWRMFKWFLIVLVGMSLLFAGEVTLSFMIKEVDHKQKLCCTVEDSGIGIEPEQMDRSFNRFYRVDKNRSRYYSFQNNSVIECFFSVFHLMIRWHLYTCRSIVSDIMSKGKFWKDSYGLYVSCRYKDEGVPLRSFPKDFSKLPTVSFIIPNHKNDMHDGTVEQADQWLKVHINPYVTWAKQHNSLLIITWDEDDFTPTNRIPTIFVGPMVKAGVYKEKINHYHVLRTVEDLYHLGQVGESAKANPIQAIWK